VKIHRCLLFISFTIMPFIIPIKLAAQIPQGKDKPIYSQHRPKYDLDTAKNISKPHDYINFLKKLDKDNIYSISTAVQVLSKQKFSTQGFDEIYFQFVEFYYTIIERTYENIIPKVENKLWDYPESLDGLNPKDIKEKRLRDFINILDKNYCTLCSTEGTYFICERNDALRKIFSDKVSPSISEFLKIRENEMKKQFFEDATLVISFKELAERVVTWEFFLKKYKGEKISDEASGYHKIYRSTLLIGFNNEPTIKYEFPDWKPVGLELEVKNAYEYTIEKYPQTNIAALLKEYMVLLKRYNYDISKLDDFFERQQIVETRAIQWFHK